MKLWYWLTIKIVSCTEMILLEKLRDIIMSCMNSCSYGDNTGIFVSVVAIYSQNCVLLFTGMPKKVRPSAAPWSLPLKTSTENNQIPTTAEG